MRLNRESAEIVKELIRLSALGLELAISMVIGLGLGLLFDRHFNTNPWGLLVFFRWEWRPALDCSTRR